MALEAQRALCGYDTVIMGRRCHVRLANCDARLACRLQSQFLAHLSDCYLKWGKSLNISTLLEGLLAISQKSKTDFALGMNMTPSGLSKILNGSRVPPYKERRLFAEQAAEYFANALYSSGCYTKLEPLFPVLYDFKSKDELRAFLATALTYVVEREFQQCTQENLIFSGSGTFYWGRECVLDTLCVILSDYLSQSAHKAPEIYASLPLDQPVYSRLFRRLRFMGHPSMENAVLHYFTTVSHYKPPPDMRGINNFEMLAGLQGKLDVRLYTGMERQGPFLLIKDSCLLLFNFGMDMSPLLIPVFHKNQVVLFHKNLMEKKALCVSYSAQEVVEALEAKTTPLLELIKRSAQCFYSFVPVAYLITREEAESTGASLQVCHRMWEMIHTLLRSDILLAISSSAIKRFESNGEAILPFAGTVKFAPDQCAEYMKRLNQLVPLKDIKAQDRIKVVDSTLSNLAVFFCEEMVVIYTIDDTGKREKLHVLPSKELSVQIRGELVEKEQATVGVSFEMWRNYCEKLQGKNRPR